MKFSFTVAVCFAAFAAGSVAMAAPADGRLPLARESVVIPGRYIIKFRSGLKPRQVRNHLADYKRDVVLEGDNDEANANRITLEYSNVYQGVAGSFSENYIEALKAQFGSRIEYVQPDMTIHAFDEEPSLGKRIEQPKPPSWGLARISQRKLDLNQPYRYLEGDGEGVDVWVVDTGINFEHSDFGGRASLNATFVQGETSPDGNGHGSHCSGTVGGTNYGVAKRATLKGVKVLSAGGSGTLAGVIAGIDHVAKYVRPGKSVMSMSLGGGRNQALNDAVDAAFKKGVVVVVAAGNNGGDACQISPASAPGAYTVAATDNADKLASFSNRGKCVKIAAPGVNIMSCWNNGKDATKTISGTSMATPHVAGVAAALMSRKTYKSPQEVYDDLTKLATKGSVQGMPADTANLLLFNGQSDEKDISVPEPPKPEEPKPEPPKNDA